MSKVRIVDLKLLLWSLLYNHFYYLIAFTSLFLHPVQFIFVVILQSLTPKENFMWWIFYALLSGSSAALLAIVVKLYLKHINALFMTLLFSLLTFIFLLIFDLYTNKVDCKLVTSLNYKEWLALLAAAFLNGFAFICYMNALKCGRTGSVVALDRLGIIYVLILSAIFLQESFSIKAMIGAVVMIIGTILISI